MRQVRKELMLKRGENRVSGIRAFVSDVYAVGNGNERSPLAMT